MSLGSPTLQPDRWAPRAARTHPRLQVTYSVFREPSWKLSQPRSHVLFTAAEGSKDAVSGAVLPKVCSATALGLGTAQHAHVHHAHALHTLQACFHVLLGGEGR